MPLEDYSQDIVETVREPLLILDTTLRVRSANRSFYQTFLVSAGETEHKLIYELGNGQWDIPELRRLLEDVVPKSSVFNDFELAHTFPVIGRRVMLLNARKLKAGNHGELVVLAMEDVTDRRRTETLLAEVDAYAQNVVDTVREPLLMLDPSLRVRSANRAFYRTFQVSPKDTEGHLIYELGSGQWDIPALRKLLDEIIPQSSAFSDYVLEYDFPGIGRKIMLLNARKLKAGDHGELLVLAMEDVTEKRRIHDLEVRFTEELQESYSRLQVLEKQRDDLTNMIVHDLRTPLSSVIMGMQTLRAMSELNELQQEAVEIAIAGGENLLDMINDLLDVEMLESGSMKLASDAISVDDLIVSAVRQVSSLAANKGVLISNRVTDSKLYLRGDEDKLRRVLVNLLGNAIKFTPSEGSVTIAACEDEQSGWAEMSVRDTGEGIPSNAFGRIFEKFGQVETRQGGRTMSTGLGLTFCKLAVEAHGGHIRVESEPGKGSTFVITLPLT